MRAARLRLLFAVSMLMSHHLRKLVAKYQEIE
jgi:hypothetical protein